MRISDVYTSQANAAHIDAKREAYMRKATDFLREQFASRIAHLPEEDISRLIKTSYAQARKRGIRTEKGHLKYLVPVVLLGLGFETDPLHRAAMINAVWLDKDGAFVPNTDFPGLFDQIDLWDAAKQVDLSDQHRLSRAFNGIYAAQHDHLTHAVLDANLRRCWPALMARINPQDREAFAQKTYTAARTHKFDGADGVVFVCLAAHFGADMLHDPQHIGLARAMADDGRPLVDRRLALGKAVAKMWDQLCPRIDDVKSL